ncbi:MAG TPA: 8-oxo-dGTP diphosphatase [Candidatus Ozemobacteraceae bacterium]|nr:8-oxo-dGTP diphosphatase [Candidatus Ozemobacteraceae bacterium]
MKLATLCYIRRNGQTLMIHRNKRPGDMHFGKWNGLGGKFDKGETPEDCARREIREESGLDARELHLKGVITFPDFAKGEDWYVFLYIVSAEGEPIRECPEGELVWVDNAKLLSLNLWEGDSIFIPWLDRPDFFSARFTYEQGRLVSHEAAFYPVMTV